MTSWGGGILGDAWWWGGVREELEFEEELGIAVLIVQRPSFPSSCLAVERVYSCSIVTMSTFHSRVTVLEN